MDKKLNVDREVLFFAFRYALGRMSYAPSTIMENIKHNIKEISTGDIRAYVKEIEECEHYGMKMDERHWLDFKTYLEAELEKR